MSSRIAQVNKHIQRTFGDVLRDEADIPDGVLVTISRVDTGPSLRRSVVWLSVFPLDRADAVVERLSQQLYVLQGALNRKLTFRPLPRIELAVDRGAQHAEHINDLLSHLNDE